MSSVRRQLSAPGTRGAERLPALAGLLHQSAQVEAKVEKCAQEISSINTMLRTQIVPARPSKGAEQALVRSEHVKEKIEQCAQELHTLNAVLAQEMRDHRKSERALASMQVRLLGAQLELLEAQSELARVRDEKEKARYFAFHDSLTGLANPNLFNDRVDHGLAYARRHQRALAVMCIDIGQSRLLGDKALQAVAERLAVSVRATDTLSRQESGYFLFLAEELADRGSAERIARKLVHALSQPLRVGEAALNVGASIGIAVYPDDGDTVETLINNADAAMDEAKRRAGGYAFFSPQYP